MKYVLETWWHAGRGPDVNGILTVEGGSWLEDFTAYEDLSDASIAVTFNSIAEAQDYIVTHFDGEPEPDQINIITLDDAEKNIK